MDAQSGVGRAAEPGVRQDDTGLTVVAQLAVDQRVQWSVTRIGVSLTVPSPAGLEERLAVRPAGGWLDERGGIDKAARETAGLIANSRGT